MLGYVEMVEAVVWIQTDVESSVSLRYWPIDDKTNSSTVTTTTLNAEARTAHFLCAPLAPGVTYNYEIFIGEDAQSFDRPLQFTAQELWQWRSDPPTFTMAAGSCAYINEEKFDRPGTPYGGDYQIFESIVTKDPDMMLWLGDNIYLREPDWYTKTGYHHRYTHTRSCPEMQSLLSHCPNYAVIDDHDFGPNNGDGSFINKSIALDAFQTFWANPSYGLDGEPGTTTQFTFVDVDFFLLDNRTERVNSGIKGVKEAVIGKDQRKWLIQALSNSTATYKIVAIGGQVINDVAIYENLAQYPEERTEILEGIDENKITGVIFLTGDRHHSELSMKKLAGGIKVYDLTVSPLTSTTYDHSTEPNTHRIKGTYYGGRAFSTLTFETKEGVRQVCLRLFDSNGKLIWEKILNPSDFKS